MKDTSKWNYSKADLFGTGNASERISQWFQKYFESKVVYDVAFLGFGPAGSGVMINMLQRKQIARLKKKKVLILEKLDSILKGNITSYHINSDTYAKTFTEFVDSINLQEVKKLANKISFKKIKAIEGNIALRNVDKFLSDASNIYIKAIKQFENIKLRKNEIAQRIIQCHNGLFKVKSILNSGSFFTEHEYYTKKVILACGGIQNRLEILNRQIDQQL
ncbi:MAG: hypothetical protein IPJ32_14100 [Sphingobacteriaceae bacterium]|nr:hypothetical protein [Sphingobacteriaceae bacterium]